MKIINMTPHAIVVKEPLVIESPLNNGREARCVTYEPSGSVVRMETESYWSQKVDGFDVHQNIVVGSNLPEPEEGTYLLVSAMVLSAFPERADLLAPDTGNAERNDKGHIVSVPGFISN